MNSVKTGEVKLNVPNEGYTGLTAVIDMKTALAATGVPQGISDKDF